VNTVAITPDGGRLVVGTASVGKPCDYVYRLTGLDAALGAASSPEATRRYVNAKVVLLGEGAVGKTSLAHRLIDKEAVWRARERIAPCGTELC